MKLAQSFGDALAFDTPQDIFAAVASAVPEFAGLGWSALGDHGLRFGEGAAPAAGPSADAQMEASP